MAYRNPGWTNNADPYINATNLNNISDTLECVPVANGGTGATTASDARANLGMNKTSINALINNNTLPIANGGTGGTTVASARSNLGIGSAALLASNHVIQSMDGTDYASAGSSITLANVDVSSNIFFLDSDSFRFTDLPSGFTDNHFHLLTLCSPSKPTNRKIQFIFPETGNAIYMKKYHGGTATSWSKITFTAV